MRFLTLNVSPTTYVLMTFLIPFVWWVFRQLSGSFLLTRVRNISFLAGDTRLFFYHEYHYISWRWVLFAQLQVLTPSNHIKFCLLMHQNPRRYMFGFWTHAQNINGTTQKGRWKKKKAFSYSTSTTARWRVFKIRGNYKDMLTLICSDASSSFLDIYKTATAWWGNMLRNTLLFLDQLNMWILVSNAGRRHDIGI